MCVSVFVCLPTCVHRLVGMRARTPTHTRVCMCAYICRYHVLITSLKVNKEEKITSLKDCKVDVGSAAKALRVGVSHRNLINQI